MGSSRPQTVRAPFEQSGTTNSASAAQYGFLSPNQDDPNVQAYLNVPLGVDPGVGRRYDLAEQGLEDDWNSAFASNIPDAIRRDQVSRARDQLRAEAGAQAQQARYLLNQQELQRRAALLPTLAQLGNTSTGSTSSQGYNTQIIAPQQGGGIGGILGGAGSVLGGIAAFT